MGKVNWGVLGTAGIAKGATIPGMIKAENCNLYAIAGRSIEKAEAFKKEFGFEKAYGSYDEMLADKNVQAVYIPLPNHIHLEWIKKAAEAGKHILCEKPMCLNRAELDEAFKVCEANNVFLMEAFAYLHSDAIIKMIDLIDEGVIGKVKLIEACFFTGGAPAGDFRWEKEYGGGAVYDLGCYSISLASAIMKEAPEKITALSRFTDKGIDDFCQMSFEYKDGAIATLGCGFNGEGRSDRMVIHGTDGKIWADIYFNQAGVNSFAVIKNNERTHYEIDVRSNYTLEVEQLGRCILEGEKTYVSREFSELVADCIDRVLKEINY